MKFTEGMWKTREGIKFDWMVNIEKVQELDNRALKLLLTKLQRHRGDQLNSATVTATVTSPAEDIIGVKYVHWGGQIDNGPHFQLSVSEKSPAKIEKAEGNVKYESGSLTLDINTSQNNFGVSFTGVKGEKLTSHSFRSVAYIGDETRAPYEDGLYRERKGYMLTELDIGVREHLYGLGERFGPFVKNGQVVDIWNEDGGTSSELAYKNIPFYYSSKGYGVFIAHPGKVSLELQSERTTRVNISVPGEWIQYYVIYGPSPKEVLKKYTALTGRPALPPAWSYNLWLTTSFTTSYDEKTVTGFLDGFKERDIPLGTFHFDCFWMKGYQWTDFEFDKEMFPDPEGYIRRIKEQGRKTCVWINPYIAQESHLFEEGKKEGYFVKRLNGDVWQWDNWQAGMALVDFTNPAACKWYQCYLEKLMDMGIDSFKTDFGERIPIKNIKYHDESDPERMHNYYTQIYNKCVFEVMEKKAGPMKGCLFARSATAGGQQFPVHWGGDCESTFEAMAETLRGGLSLAMSGFGFWAHDIGGFEGTPDPTLYKRWCQFGLLSSHSRLHGSSSYRVPWIYDDEACDVLREAVKRKLSLMPYLLRIALEAHQQGVPTMRPTFMEFPDDLTTYSIDTQFFLGPNLLVAPVFSESGEVSFYVPETEGEWVSWFDWNKKYKSGKWYTETCDIMTLPILVRPGTVTPFNPQLTDPEGDWKNGLAYVVNGPLPEAGVEVQFVDPKKPDTVVEKAIVKLVDGEANVEGAGEATVVIR